MNSHQNYSRPCKALLFSLWIVLICSTLTVHAEVGVMIDPSGPTSTVSAQFILQTIVDDSEPVGIVWARFNGDTEVRKVLNDQGYANGDGNPSMIINAFSGKAVAVWARNSPSGYDIVLSRLENDVWSAQQVVADSAVDLLDPYLISDPSDGTHHLVYWERGTVARVMYSSAPADLSAWSTPVQVSGISEIACRPSAVLHGGELNVVYENHHNGLDTAPRQIVWSLEDQGIFTTQTLAMTYYADSNWPRINARDGELWIEWIDAETAFDWIKMTSPGVWGSLLSEPFQTNEEKQFHVRGTIKSLAIQAQ